MGKTSTEYDQVFEELMYYKVIDVNSIRSMSDIADQLRFDRRIGFMKNRNLFIDKMTSTFPARLLSSGKLKADDFKIINSMNKGFNKEMYTKLIDKRFKNSFKKSESNKDYIMVDGYIFDRDTQLVKRVNARLDLISLLRGKRVVLRDVATGKFVSAKKMKNIDKK